MAAKASITPLTIPQRMMIIIAGLAFIGAGVFMYADIFNFGKGVNTTKGTIVSTLEERTRHRSGSTTRTSTVYRPIVTFNADGKQYKFMADVASDSYKAGQTVKVNYDPNDPSRSPSLAGMRELVGPGIAALCGAIAILFGFLAPSKKTNN